jgi:FkbM family methyltransferase
MARLIDRIGSSIYKSARYAATAAGLERNRWGGKLLAEFNILGEQLSRKLLLRNRPFKVDGHLIYLADKTGPSVSFSTEVIGQKYEQETSGILKTLLQPGMTVVDVGAHVGCHALLAARLVGPQGKVFAFEASPENFSLLQKNVALNGYQNIECVQKAVSNRSGTITFHLSPEGNDRNSIYDNSRTGRPGRAVTVPATTLDEFMSSADWPRINVVKIDVEGAEPLVFEGMSELLHRSHDVALIIEFAPACLRESGHNPEAVLAAISDFGFEIEVLEGTNAPQLLPSAEFAAFVKKVETEGMKNLLCRTRRLEVNAGESQSGHRGHGQGSAV